MLSKPVASLAGTLVGSGVAMGTKGDGVVSWDAVLGELSAVPPSVLASTVLECFDQALNVETRGSRELSYLEVLVMRYSFSV